MRQPEANFRRLEGIVASLAHHEPDLVCLPECTLTGYLYQESDLVRFAEPIPGETTQRMAYLARQHCVHLCFGMLERSAQGVYNTAMLLDRRGSILLIQRKVSEKPPFLAGKDVRIAETELGRIAILTCGDLFDQQALSQVSGRADLLLVPMARAFAGRSPDPQRWEGEERALYLRAVAQAGVRAAIINARDAQGAEPSFGGAPVVSGRGELLAESPHGSEQALVFDLK
jgi:predicted amidohydrolase